MEKKNTSPELKEIARYMKRNLVYSRIMGVLFCLLCAAALAFLYFKVFDPWTCMMVVSFALAGIFISNAQLQGIKVGRRWQVVNLVIAFVCYAAVIVFVVIGFVNGTIRFGF